MVAEAEPSLQVLGPSAPQARCQADPQAAQASVASASWLPAREDLIRRSRRFDAIAEDLVVLFAPASDAESGATPEGDLIMGIEKLVEEVAGAIAAKDAVEAVDPNAGFLTEAAAAVAGFEGVNKLTDVLERKEEAQPAQPPAADDSQSG